jgi:hypothetical protein
VRLPRRRYRRIGVAVAGLLFLAWIAIVTRTLILAHDDVHSGMQIVDSVRYHVTPVDLAAGKPIPLLRQAHDDFVRAHDRLGGPLLFGARFVPVLGRQLRSATAISAAAVKVSGVAIDGATDVRSILNRPSHGLSDEGQTARALAGVTQRSVQELQNVPLGPSKGLVALLSDLRATMATDMVQLHDALDRASAGTSAMASFLGGSHRYLVFAANNAEMRAGSGMFLSVGELTVGSNGFQLGPMQTVTTIPVPVGAVPLDGDLAVRWGWLAPNVEWRNLMLSPRFDISAPLAAQMWVALGHQPVDGVMALDSIALQNLLVATGPVTAGGRRTDESTVIDELLHGQYLRFDTQLVDQNNQRREELGAIAAAAFDSLSQGRWSRPALGDGLARSARGRHIMMWSRDPTEQAGWHALAIDGSLSPNSLMVSVLNRGGNKLDYFLYAASDVTFAAHGRDTEVTVKISLDNRVPAAEPVEVAGPDSRTGAAAGVYVGLLSLTMPGGATDGHFDGVNELAVAGHDGPTEVMAFPFQVDAGQQRTIVAHFLVPGRSGSLHVEPSARVLGIAWTAGNGLRWSDGTAQTVTWSLP